MDILSKIAKLEDVVRQAEARAQADKLALRKREVQERLQQGEERLAEVQNKLRVDGQKAKTELKEVEEGEQRLREVTRKMAQYHVHLEREALPDETVRQLREELETLRKSAKLTLETLEQEESAARKELREALDQYHQLEREEERLQIAAEGAEDLVKAAELHFLGRQIEQLAREIEDAERHFSFLDSRQQKAQLTIWIGRYRQLQDRLATDETEDATEEQIRTHERIFPTLVGLSKKYMPGYIEAFRESFTTDWGQYIEQAQELLRQASEESVRKRAVEERLSARLAEDLVARRQNREEGLKTLEEVKCLVNGSDVQTVDPAAFRDLVAKAILNLGASEAELLRVVFPFRDLLTDGREFRALRRHLERGKGSESGEPEESSSAHEDAAALTSGMRAVMIGGAAREEVRRNLELVFRFSELEWISHENHRPAALGGLERSIRNQGVDLILLIKDLIGHSVSEKLRPLCEQHGIPCLMIPSGYGSGQVAETVRRGLARGPSTNGKVNHD